MSLASSGTQTKLLMVPRPGSPGARVSVSEDLIRGEHLELGLQGGEFQHDTGS